MLLFAHPERGKTDRSTGSPAVLASLVACGLLAEVVFRMLSHWNGRDQPQCLRELGPEGHPAGLSVRLSVVDSGEVLGKGQGTGALESPPRKFQGSGAQ